MLLSGAKCRKCLSVLLRYDLIPTFSANKLKVGVVTADCSVNTGLDPAEKVEGHLRNLDRIPG